MIILWRLLLDVLQARLQGHGGAVKHVVVNVPHAVSDNGVPHQLTLTSKSI